MFSRRNKKSVVHGACIIGNPSPSPSLRGRGIVVAAIVLAAALVVARAPAQQSQPEQRAADPREKDVRELIDHYFRTWSAKDIERYGQCFMPQAVVQLINTDGKLVSMPLQPFLKTQRDAHSTSKVDLKETAETVDVRFEGNLARVVVFWKLTAGEKVETGYDHYTLMQSEGQWRIANLIFYNTPAAAK